MTSLFALAPDLLLLAASLGAAIYCMILSRRVSRLSSFDAGIGGAIAVLSAQVDEMKGALAQAKAGTDGAGHQLEVLVRQARDISTELELMIAACHDFAEAAIDVQNQAQGGTGGSPANSAEATATSRDIPAPPADPAQRPGNRAANAAGAIPDLPEPSTNPPFVFGTRRPSAPTPETVPAPEIVPDSDAGMPYFRHRDAAVQG